MKFPPETPHEFAQYLKYQKQEGLALDLIPRSVKLNNGKIITIPDEVREAIAQEDNFIDQTRPLIEAFLQEELDYEQFEKIK